MLVTHVIVIRIHLQVDSVLRKHTSKDSFSSANKPFIQHPTSSVSQSFDKEKTAYIHTLRKLLNSFKDKLLSDSPDENSLRYTPKYTPKRDSTTLFLTKEELDAAQNNIRNRYLDIIGSESTSFLQQKRIRPEVTRDEGLEWLYESDVMFVDSGQEIDNKVIHNFSYSNRIFYCFQITYKTFPRIDILSREKWMVLFIITKLKKEKKQTQTSSLLQIKFILPLSSLK